MDPITEADALLRGHVEDMREHLDDAVDGTRARLRWQIQEHPMRTMLMVVGAGVLVGMMFGIGRRRRRKD
jgi:hypothetical protein